MFLGMCVKLPRITATYCMQRGTTDTQPFIFVGGAAAIIVEYFSIFFMFNAVCVAFMLPSRLFNCVLRSIIHYLAVISDGGVRLANQSMQGKCSKPITIRSWDNMGG